MKYIIIIAVLIQAVLFESSQSYNQATKKFNLFLKDISNNEITIPELYKSHFIYDSSSEEIAQVFLTELKKSPFSTEVKIEQLKPDNLINNAIINSADYLKVEKVYQANLENETIFFSLIKNKLIFFIPLNEGRKGIITF